MDNIDKTKQIQEKNNDVKQAYESFQTQKFKQWKKLKEDSLPKKGSQEGELITPSEPRQAEQIAFEDYLANQEFYNAPEGHVWGDLDSIDECMKYKAGVYRVGTQTLNKPSKEGGVHGTNQGPEGAVEIFFENTGWKQTFQRYTSSTTLNTYVRFHRGYGSGKHGWNEWKLIGGDGGSSSTSQKGTKIVEYNYNSESFSNLTKRAYTETGFVIKPEHFGKIDNGDYVLIHFKKGKVKDYQDMTMTIYGQVRNKVEMTSMINITGLGYSTGSEPKAGGKPVAPSELPDIELETNEEKNVIYGHYGVNLFDYKEMSKDNNFGVDGKVFYNKDYTIFDTRSNANAKIYNRLRKKDQLTVKATLLDIDTTKTNAKFQIKAIHGGDGDFDINLNNKTYGIDKVISSTKTFNEASYFRFQLGGDGAEIKSRVKIDAWYGDFKTEHLDQSFAFTYYNGIPLRAMPLYDPSGNPKPDIGRDYKLNTGSHMREFIEVKHRGNLLQRKIGLIKLKDVTEWKYEIDRNDNHLLLIPVPDDCLTTTTNLMTNNLCDITADDFENNRNNDKNRPFFIRDLGSKEFDIIQTNDDGVLYDKTGKPKTKPIEKDCFQINIKGGNLSDWAEHLAKTEIMYELKPQVPIYLPYGGQVYVMTNREMIYTSHYKEITVPLDKKKSKYIIKLTGNIFGGADKTILVDEIVDVIDLSGPKVQDPKP